MLAQTRRALNKVEKRSKSTTRRIARAAGRAFRKVGAVAGGGLAAAAVVGARSAINLQRTLLDIEIQSGASKEEMEGLTAAIKATSKATAISRGDLAKTSKRLVDLLGPAGRSAELMDLLGRTAVASGADTAELAGLISAVSDSMGIAADDTVRMESALSAFLAAGKLGKVPLEEMAIVLQDISSTFKDVSSGGPEAAADLAAALQVARKSFGSAAKAGTGLEAFIGSLIKKSAALKKLKVDVFVGKGAAKRLLPFRDILDQIQKRALNVQELTEALGRKEAAKFAKILTSEEGREEFERIATAARGATDVSEDFGKRTEAAVFKMDSALNQAKNSFSDLASPERLQLFADSVDVITTAIAELVNVLEVAGDALGRAAGFVVKDVIGGVTGGIEGGDIARAREFLDAQRIEKLAKTRAEATKAGALRGGVLDPGALSQARERIAARAEEAEKPGVRERTPVEAATQVLAEAGPSATREQTLQLVAAQREEAAEARQAELDAAVVAAADLQGVQLGAGSEDFRAQQALLQDQINATNAQTAALSNAFDRGLRALGEQLGAQPPPRARPGGDRGGGRAAPLVTGARR